MSVEELSELAPDGFDVALVERTSATQEQRFGPGWAKRLAGVKVISIGPQTSRSCLQCFGRVNAEADPHDLEGLADACAQAMQIGS